MSTCSYGPNGVIPKDGSFISGFRSRNVSGCSGKFADVETNDATVNEELRAKEVIDAQNVKYYGAVGDGVTDDTAAFKTAISLFACPIYVPEGNYVISEPLEFGLGGGIIGACYNSSRLYITHSEPNAAFLTLNGDRGMLRNFRILNLGSNATTSTYVKFNAKDIIVENVLAETTTVAYGVEFTANALDCLVTGSRFWGTTTCVRFSGAGIRNVIANTVLSTASTTGVVVNTTNAGRNNRFVSNLFRAPTVAPSNNVIEGVNQSVFVANVVNPTSGGGYSSTVATSIYLDENFTQLPYTAASAVNWNASAPITVKAALDRIAAALGPIA